MAILTMINRTSWGMAQKILNASWGNSETPEKVPEAEQALDLRQSGPSPFRSNSPDQIDGESMTQFSIAASAFALIAMPGPTNTLLALAAHRRGVWQLAILATTVVAAYLLVVVLLTVLTGGLLHSHPQVAAALKLVAAAWVLYLAFRLWSAAGPLSAADLSVRHVLITTLLNPKAIIIGLAMVPVAGVSTQIPHLLTIAFAVAAASMLWLAIGKLVIGEQERLPTAMRRGSCAMLMLFSASLTASLFT